MLHRVGTHESASGATSHQRVTPVRVSTCLFCPHWHTFNLASIFLFSFSNKCIHHVDNTGYRNCFGGNISLVSLTVGLGEA